MVETSQQRCARDCAAAEQPVYDKGRWRAALMLPSVNPGAHAFRATVQPCRWLRTADELRPTVWQHWTPCLLFSGRNRHDNIPLSDVVVSGAGDTAKVGKSCWHGS
jgi:hypothetical protein